VIFGLSLPVPARHLKKLRPVPARARKFESRGLPGPVLGHQRRPADLTSRKIRLFCHKKTLEFKFSLKKLTDFGFLHLI
jgi:hypothetical protein